MCLISFAYKVHPEYPLILIANRDEFYNRPTREVQFWTEEGFPDILAGKDLKDDGTWLGTHKYGKWAALTNYRNINHLKVNAPSRGNLVLDFLKTDYSAESYLSDIRKNAAQYNDFNLLLFDGVELMHYSNVTDEINSITKGIHGLSNALLDTPWSKVKKITNDLEAMIQKNNLKKEDLFSILQNEDKAKKEDLPSTGLPLDLEVAMSSIFIHTPFYGTRCSSIIFIDKKGIMQFTEQRYSNNKEVLSKVEFEYCAHP